MKFLSMSRSILQSKQAEVRGEEQKTRVKSIVLKTAEGNFILGLVSGDRRIDLKKLAKIVKTKKLDLASPKEVLKITGCEIGSVHPFGNLHKLRTYLDNSILENNKVNFNAGLHTITITIMVKDLVTLINPTIENFSHIG
jgi:Cys-tRNA(Pro) deacylase